MQIKLFITAFILSCAALSSSAQTSNNRADGVLTDMAQAAKRGDKKRLAQLLPQTKGHALEPWAAYWDIRARLNEASNQEIQEVLTRYAGTYQEDRLRNDWLLLLGQRRDWETFAQEYPRFRMNDDKEVRCYALLTDFLRSGADVAAEVRKNWLEQRELDDGCTSAVQTLYSAQKFSENDIWRKARAAAENNRPRVALRAVQIVAPQVLPTAERLLNEPAKYLASKVTASGRVNKELITLALIEQATLNGAGSNLAASALEEHWSVHLNQEQRNWTWGAIGKESAKRLEPQALSYFAKVTKDSDLPDDQLAWKTRAALRAGKEPRWSAVLQATEAMSEDARKEPVWVYWRARALQKGSAAQQAQSTALLQSIASVRGFYELLALEELGQKIVLPFRPEPPTAQEKAAARNNPGLARALYAIGMGLRAEGVREWNYSTNLVNANGQRGSMTDRELLAAAQLACEFAVWDRCINTSERTKGEFDIEQRFPMPYREQVIARTGQIGLDPAYVYGLIRQESRFVTDARSGVGASGLMQVMPATARWTAKKIGLSNYADDNITKLETNIAIGTGYLKLVLDSFDGSMPLAAAAYNAGPSRPRAWRNGPVVEAAIWAENVPFHETRDYVKKVLANATIYSVMITGKPQSLKARLGFVGPREATMPAENLELP